ncbi:metallophosphoesterase [Roseibium sp. RKSG952]|uniref:metallophosphoesterase n=1 Tax=Roseibium sp. RKSG952 TaxID=2529384 RepID=UPI0018AD2F12|nr:metallophosphoesterase [Roseibium sp. RKSG952]
MKIHVYSDIHAEINYDVEVRANPDADVTVVAGDVSNSAKATVDWLLRNTPENTPCVFVAGNHEFYNNEFPGELDTFRELCSREDRLVFLENDVRVIDGVRFVGATLWTDYALYGDPASGMIAAGRAINDHYRVRHGCEAFLPKIARETHLLSRGFILNALVKPFDGPSVVVTHHCPHPRSIHPKYNLSPINVAFVSDLTETIHRGQADLWIHGHTHSSFDYRVSNTRVVCNPYGYGDENPSFDPDLIVEV